MFGWLSSKEKLATVKIAFTDRFESDGTCAVGLDGRIGDAEDNWIWALYYAKALYVLSDPAIAQGLKHQLEAWASEHYDVLTNFDGVPDFREFVLDSDIHLTNLPAVEVLEVYTIDVLSRGENKFPSIQTHLASGGFQNRFATSVLALAQFFLERDKNKGMFLKELPAYITLMQMYYEQYGYKKLRSTTEAPVQAIKAIFEARSKMY